MQPNDFNMGIKSPYIHAIAYTHASIHTSLQHLFESLSVFSKFFLKQKPLRILRHLGLNIGNLVTESRRVQATPRISRMTSLVPL